jgi:hypothetical protein
MDKNMIHIDDLVRQRLGGGQESERPGAWLTMRDLLDKEMPVAVESATNWRRIFGYFTALLLLTTASVGGYKMYSDRAGNNVAGGGGTGMQHTGGEYASSAPLSNNSSTNNNTYTASTEAISSSDLSNNNGNSEGINTSTNAQAPAALAGSTARNNNNPSRSAPAGNSHAAPSTTGTNTGLGAEAQVNDRLQPSANGSNDVAIASTSNNGSLATLRQAPATEVANATMPVRGNVTRTANQANLYASSANTTVHGNRNRSAQPNMSNGAMSAGNITSSSNGPSLQPKPANKTISRSDSFRKVEVDRLEIIARRVYDPNSQKTYYRLDTFPAGRMIIERPVVLQEELTARNTTNQNNTRRTSVGDKRSVPSNNVPAANGAVAKTSAGNPLIVPASSVNSSVAAADNSAYESLEKHKVSTKHFSLWDAEKFNDAVNSVKFKLAKVQMYPGLMAGINASVFTPNSLGGFQFGLTSLFVLNDWWSLMAELKYLHRFNTGSTVRDDYKHIIDDGSAGTYLTSVGGAPYRSYDWKDETVDHYFNYEVVKTFELPLALRYSWGRFYAQGGLNFVYSGAIDAKEVSHNRGDVTSHHDLRPETNPIQPFITNNSPRVYLSDFGSRFGTGYVVGGGFSFTPAVYLDFRVAQTFWDNANTTGAKQISRDLLRTPSFQLSVGYRFSQKH